MNVIKKTSEYELITKKSRFISYLYFVKSVDEVNNYLNDLKIKYKDASHICYAYIINNDEKYNDDKEPSKTAGYPMLNLLKKNDINYVLAVVVRYFGGIKLGTGGLLKAYTGGLTSAITKTSLEEVINGYLITCEFSYNNEKKYSYLFRDKNIIAKSYQEKCIYKVEVEDTFLNEIQSLQDLTITNKVKQLITKK